MSPFPPPSEVVAGKMVTCKKCKHTYKCTMWRGYYNFTNTEDGVCEPCMRYGFNPADSTMTDFGLGSLLKKLDSYNSSEDLKERVNNLYMEIREMGTDACLFERDDEFEWCLRAACDAAYKKGQEVGR